MTEKLVTYRPIKDGATYDVFVSQLFDPDEYRVELREEYDPHIVELFDLKLSRPTDRRRLENYVANLRKRVRIYGVWFGSQCDNHYSLDRYREQYRSWGGKHYLSDINL